MVFMEFTYENGRLNGIGNVTINNNFNPKYFCKKKSFDGQSGGI